MKQNEYHLHKQVVEYIKLKYPDVIFRSDLAQQAHRVNNSALQYGKGWPDLQILEARKDFHGFFIEIKTSESELYKKNGDWKTKHIEEQWEMLKKLDKKGYAVGFGCGFDMIIKLVDWYLKE